MATVRSNDTFLVFLAKLPLHAIKIFFAYHYKCYREIKDALDAEWQEWNDDKIVRKWGR